jgi:hypothetical protein
MVAVAREEVATGMGGREAATAVETVVAGLVAVARVTVLRVRATAEVQVALTGVLAAASVSSAAHRAGGRGRRRR